MNSNKRKAGGSWRRSQIKRSDGMVLPQAKTRAGHASVVGASLHAKPGKDRTKQTTGAKIEAVVRARAINNKASDKGA